MMTLHLIEGEAGSAYARAKGCVAIVVDTLRASATAAMLLEAGARELHVVRRVDDARACGAALPGALLLGEREGLPPTGFDAGNSPIRLPQVSGRPVVFCTTTGTARVLDAIGARAVYMGTTINATAVAAAALAWRGDIVVIPAGREGDPAFDAYEDWVGAAVIAERIVSGARRRKLQIREGEARYRQVQALVQAEGVSREIARSTHANRLRELGFTDDVAFCSRVDITRTVPRVAVTTRFGAILRSEAP